MATRNIVLTEIQAALVDRLVACGRCQNASEALRAGVFLLERAEAEINDLRARLIAGIDDYRDGIFAEGSGEEAIRRALSSARART